MPSIVYNQQRVRVVMVKDKIRQVLVGLALSRRSRALRQDLPHGLIVECISKHIVKLRYLLVLAKM